MDERHHKWARPLARAGYAARGLIYLIIGGLALLAGLGQGGGETGSKNALDTLLSNSFGSVIVWVLIFGLIGYALWRVVQSVFDTDDHGHGFKGFAVRGGLMASAFTYGALAVYAFGKVGASNSSSGESGGIAPMIAGVVGSKWAAILLALVFLGVAGAHFYKAFKRKYEKHFEASEEVMKVVHPVAIIGLVARGIIFFIIALLFFYRFLSAGSDMGSTPGMEEALNFIRNLPAGSWLLAAMGAGLIAFALYSLCEAVWRRINLEDADAPV